MMRPYASNVEQSCLGKSLAICMTRGPLGLHEIINSATSLFRGPVLYDEYVYVCVCVRVRMTRGPLGLHEIMNSATSLFRGPVLYDECVYVCVCVCLCVCVC